MLPNAFPTTTHHHIKIPSRVLYDLDHKKKCSCKAIHKVSLCARISFFFFSFSFERLGLLALERKWFGQGASELTGWKLVVGDPGTILCRQCKIQNAKCIAHQTKTFST
jgi:hypothetical protein